MSEFKQITFKTIADVPEFVISKSSMLWNKTGSWRYLRPRYLNMVPPCNQGCPAGNDVEGFITLVLEKKYLEAWQRLKEENPFPAVCGRVCYHPCETVCNRTQYDHAIAIHTLERFVADQAPINSRLEKLKKDSGRSIAIVGSGPAGLTAAYHLARMGHGVTVYEADEEPGGLMRYGIPEYRLPNAILDTEIDSIRNLGVEILCNHRIGVNKPWSDLDSFDAIFVAVGVHHNSKLGIENEESPGVISGLELLGTVARGKKMELGQHTVIIGGGNSAIDSARCALRMGSKVSLFYHRSRNEMPAYEEEIYEAEREGLRIHYLCQPVKILVENNRLQGIQFRQTKLGEPDDSGRRRPEPIPGTEYDVPADTIVTAIGESAELDFLPKTLKTRRKKIEIGQFGNTSLEKVFSGGDAALQEQNVTVAIGSGKAAACAIDAFLNGQKLDEKSIIGENGAVSVVKYLKSGKAHSETTETKHVVDFKELNLNYFDPTARHKAQKLDMNDRMTGFSEINLAYSEEAAQIESNRCFHCGVCTMCDNCFVYCPDVAIARKDNGKRGYDIAMDYCKGCGICVHECPRSAMLMEEE
ncbi:FAD-dependent oxidoreductase [bacterium]|nr:FAD-dependent oxidoreductase [bacterium]